MTRDVPVRTPSPRANRWMVRMLETPGVQRLVGRSIALLTVRGRKTGTSYQIPIGYRRNDGEVTMLSRRIRRWWRNLKDEPAVRLRLAGKEYRGRATIIEGEAAVDIVREFLRGRRKEAHGYGLSLDAGGLPPRNDVEPLVPRLVVIRVAID